MFKTVMEMLIMTTIALNTAIAVETKPQMRIDLNPTQAAAPFLSWDTETGKRADTNLLRHDESVRLRISVAGQWYDSDKFPATVLREDGHSDVSYRITVAPDAELVWQIQPAGDRMAMTVTGTGAGLSKINGLELIFPFDARVTATTVLPSVWQDDGKVRSPLLIHAPDFGQILLQSKTALTARLEGDYAHRAVNLIIELPQPKVQLEFTLAYLPKPDGVLDEGMWRLARRGWFNVLAPLSDMKVEVTILGKKYKTRDLHAPGMLGNEVISGNASCSTWMYADHVFWLPELPAKISAAALLRRTLDETFKVRLGADGSLVGYWMPTSVGAYSDFLDSQPSILISAWDYVEATKDRDWLAQNIEQLERVAGFLRKRDIDGDGLIEAVQSGNAGTLVEPHRSSSWWDAVNTGHKDGYSNLLIYRGLCCLADLESKLSRADAARHYSELAGHLKKAFTKALWNPATGWFGWWRSADGQLHDPASPLINALAIEYGLVSPAQGREILARLRKKMSEVGFTHFELGVPSMLVPIPKKDYLQDIPAGICGVPVHEDGADTFGKYENGGIHAGHTLHYLAALYIVGEPDLADQILRAMLARQQLGLFQNGVWGQSPRGAEWQTWDGKPSGADGYLADNFRFLDAVMLREPAMRKKFYRPLTLAVPATRNMVP